MLKKSRKALALLIIMSLVATLFIGIGTASAASTYTMSATRTVKSGGTRGTGTLTIDIPQTTSTSGYVYMTLPASPEGFSIPNIATIVPAEVDGSTNALQGATITVEPTSSDNRVWRIAFSGVPTGSYGNPGRMILYSTGSETGGLSVNIPSGFSGEVNAVMSTPSSQIFSKGTVTLCRVGTGTVIASVESVTNLSSSGGDVGILGFSEGLAGAFTASDKSVTLTLPPGFKWSTATKDTFYWGSEAWFNALTFDLEKNNGRELRIKAPYESASGTYFTVKATIDVDESVAKTGDVTVTLGGDSTVSPGTLIIATYGDYNVTAKAMEKLDILAGKTDAKLGKFSIAEALAGSLTENRTITLTLPENAKWTNFPVLDADLSKRQDQIAGNNTWVVVGSDNRTIKLVVKGNSGTAGASDPAELVYKDAKIVTGPDFTPGDIKVQLGGSMGVDGDLVLANVKALISGKASATPDVKIGLPDQTVGDLTIVESAAAAIDANKNFTYKNDDDELIADSNSDQTRIEIACPPGVRFTSTPTVQVTDGDLQIDSSGVKIDSDSVNLFIPVKSQSTKASTIKISNIKLTVDRTVPEGALTLKVRGNAVNQSLSVGGDDDIFPGAINAAKVDVAKCVTPAPGETKQVASFTIDSKKYTVAGVEKEMDVAPYIKDGRTFMPLRYVGMSLGVMADNIIWDDATKTATLIKGSTVVQVKVGSTVMTVVGVNVNMDVAPEIVDGRVMLPLRFVAQAFGAQLNWDDATKTATFTL